MVISRIFFGSSTCLRVQEIQQMFEALLTRSFTTQVAECYVLLEGPMVAATLTPDEALFLAEQLIAAATHAVGQRSDT
jgi:hypothetical protein